VRAKVHANRMELYNTKSNITKLKSLELFAEEIADIDYINI
jgi:hypothetical protein